MTKDANNNEKDIFATNFGMCDNFKTLYSVGNNIDKEAYMDADGIGQMNEKWRMSTRFV